MVKDKDGNLPGYIKTILSYVKALDNKDRREILRQCREKPKTISELKRILKSSNKVTYANVKYLEKEHMVKLDKRSNEKHHPVYVISNATPLQTLWFVESIIDMIYKEKEI